PCEIGGSILPFLGKRSNFPDFPSSVLTGGRGGGHRAWFRRCYTGGLGCQCFDHFERSEKKGTRLEMLSVSESSEWWSADMLHSDFIFCYLILNGRSNDDILL